MQVQIAIGENHRFELGEALLVYYGNQTTFITKHEVTTQQNAAPTLGPAQPLPQLDAAQEPAFFKKVIELAPKYKTELLKEAK